MKDKNKKISELIDKWGGDEELNRDYLENFNTEEFNVKEGLMLAFDELETLYEGSSERMFKTGFNDLNRMISGLLGGRLYLIGGIAGIGKSALLEDIAMYINKNEKGKIGYFSLEHEKRDLIIRFLGSEAQVDIHGLFTGYLNEDDWNRITNAAGIFCNNNNFIFSTGVFNFKELIKKIKKMKSETNIEIIFIDGLELIKGFEKDQSELEKMNKIIKELKYLALELNIPIIITSKLIRESNNKLNKKPIMQDLPGNGTIESICDVILFIYRDEYYNSYSEKQGIAEISIVKNNYGPVGEIELLFQQQYMKFINFLKDM